MNPAKWSDESFKVRRLVYPDARSAAAFHLPEPPYVQHSSRAFTKRVTLGKCPHHGRKTRSWNST